MPACRSCAMPVEFERTASGKLMPVEADGVSHFARCPEAKRWSKERSRPPDDVCTSCGSLNVENLPGKAMHAGAIRCRDCGRHRWLRKPA